MYFKRRVWPRRTASRLRLSGQRNGQTEQRTARRSLSARHTQPWAVRYVAHAAQEMANDEADDKKWPLFGNSIRRLQGTPTLQLPAELLEPLTDHLEELRNHYIGMNWCKRAGWGDRPAVVVVDLALYWTKPSPMGSNVDSVVDASLEVLEAARAV